MYQPSSSRQPDSLIQPPVEFVFAQPFPTDESAQPIAGTELGLSDLQQKLFVRLKALEKTLFLDKQQFAQITDTLAEKAGIKQGFAEIDYYVKETPKGNLGDADPRVLDGLYTAQYDRLNRCIAACDSLIQIVDRSTPFAALLAELETMVS